MKPLIECVPNFSEGRNPEVIEAIAQAIRSVPGVSLLDVDPGAATHRTVMTLAGEPEPVCEAAFRAMRTARQLIDMRQHQGAHPRFGATDVCPLIPVANITMEETAQWARRLAERVGRELDYPVYLYEEAASRPERRSLATVRSGEYEGLASKLADPAWAPDFGPARFVAETGATAIGARDFLIAVNFNLNTTSTRRANAVAFDVREAGRVVKTTQADGTVLETRQPGTLPGTRAIGWFIDEYGIAQVSMNITRLGQTPLHIAFDEVAEAARKRGLRVTGTEIVGLIPLRVLTDAGRHYLSLQQRSRGVSEAELIKIAVKSMGLDDLKPFEPEKKVIEYVLGLSAPGKLVGMNLQAFAEETASESPAPGGGSISAYVGALGTALGTMVANLSSHKRGWDERWEEFSRWAEQGQDLQKQLLASVDEDTAAFNAIMEAMSLPKSTEAEKVARKEALQAATRLAIEVPLRVMRLAYAGFPLVEAMAQIGNPNSLSDAGVGALCLRTAVLGAWMNVKINAAGCDEAEWLAPRLAEAEQLKAQTLAWEQKILAEVEGKL